MPAGPGWDGRIIRRFAAGHHRMQAGGTGAGNTHRRRVLSSSILNLNKAHGQNNRKQVPLQGSLFNGWLVEAKHSPEEAPWAPGEAATRKFQRDLVEQERRAAEGESVRDIKGRTGLSGDCRCALARVSVKSRFLRRL